MKYKIQSNYQGKNNKRELANTEYRKFSRLKLHNNQLEGGIKNCKWRAHILQYLLLVSKRHFKTQGNFSLHTIYNVSFLPFFHTFFEILESKHTIYLRQKRSEGKLNCPHKPLNVPHGFTLWWLFLSCLSSLMRLLMVSSTAIMDSWTVSWDAEVSLSLGGFSFKWEMNVLRTCASITRLGDGFKKNTREACDQTSREACCREIGSLRCFWPSLLPVHSLFPCPLESHLKGYRRDLI